MTHHQSDDLEVDPAVISDRSMPLCRCPANCGGVPEARVKLASPYPVVTPGSTHAKPPAEPYHPVKQGELVHDTLSGRTGVFMARLGNAVYLRPEGGGEEWEADPRWIARPPVSLGAKVVLAAGRGAGKYVLRLGDQE